MSLGGFEALAGRLLLCPGAEQPVRCERPMVGATMMRRLAEGRRAALLPELVAAVFTLGAAAQRSTARRAVQAAFGHIDDAAAAARDRETLRLTALREHLQRLALDLPSRVPVAGAGPDPGWLRELPAEPDADAIARRLLGRPAADWLQRWRAEGGDWLARWAATSRHPVARWLAGVQAPARAARWPLAALPDAEPAALPALATDLAAALAADPHFAERPRWSGHPAETGPWTRGVVPAINAWDRLGARLAEVVALAAGAAPAAGALALAPGQGIAWTAMSRGLLLHWVRLDGLAPEQARIAAFHVLAPTEWNFHPEGGFGRALRSGAIAPDATALAAAALDPCLETEVMTHA
jgi:hypothetical protein